MKKAKRILALMGVVLLLLLYGSTMFFAFSDHPQALDWAKASILCTIAVPIILYAFLLAARVFGSRFDAEEAIPDDADSTTVDTVILDIGDVLARFDWQGFLRKKGYDDETLQILRDAVFKNNDWEAADKGLLTEEEILQSFIDNAPDYEKEIRDIYEHMGETIHTFPYTEKWIQKLRRMNLHIYYLSNYSQPLYERTKEELSFLYQLDGGYMSYEIHCMKPDQEIYQKLLNDFDLDPARCVFIDDRLENVVGARAIGMQAIHFTGINEAMKALKELL